MRVLIVANNDVGLYKFRRELIEELLKSHEVYISLPSGEYVSSLVNMGCVYEACEFDRHGTNPAEELRQYFYYKKLIKKTRPQIVFTYTIKPNIYAGMACASLKVPYVANITGLGTAVEGGGLMQKVLLRLYAFGLRKAQKVFFQNQSNLEFMVRHGVVKGAYDLLPGSGVNLDEHCAEPYPERESPLVLATVGRIMKDKGSDEVLYAAQMLHQENPDLEFQMIGSFDGDYEEQILAAQEQGYIRFLGQQSDVHAYLKEVHAIVHASYHEGMSNVLLEAAACGRPIIATDVPGCRETFEDGVSGVVCRARDGEDLVRAIRAFAALPYAQKAAMGSAGRQKAEREFDRRIVIEKYLNEIAVVG